jgi:HEAT repeat protein
MDMTTMTEMYRAIEQRLWKKDVERLVKTHEGRPVSKLEVESCDRQGIEALVSKELAFLEGLAFTGLHTETAEFDLKLCQAACRLFAPGLIPGKTLPNLSFLRTSDLKAETVQSYHYLHLTYQEYFAARYFVRQWTADPPQTLVLDCRDHSDAGWTPVQYLQHHRYTPRYNIFWRFASGLLNAEGRAKEFFEVIEHEPRDILGPMHQRLVIHCLAEIPEQSTRRQHMLDFAPLQSVLEKHLFKWLIFDCMCRRSGQMNNTLLREAELSSKVMLKAFQKTRRMGNDWLEKLSDRLRCRQSIPIPVCDLLSSWLRVTDDCTPAILGALGNKTNLPDTLISQMVSLLESSNSDVRGVAAWALKVEYTLPEEILRRLVELLGSDDARAHAAIVLGHQPSLPASILQQIMSHFDSNVLRTRILAAMEALGNQRALPDEILVRIMELVNDDEHAVRTRAITALCNQTAPTENVLKRVIALMDDYKRRKQAVEAQYNRTAPKEALVKGIIAQIDDEQRYVRRITVKALCDHIAPTENVLKRIIVLLDDEEPSFRVSAIEALGNQEGLSDDVLDRLVALLDDDDQYVQISAVKALGKNRILPERIIQKILPLLENRQWPVQEAATRALGNQAVLAVDVLYRLAALLDNDNRYLQISVIKALGKHTMLPEDIIRKMLPILDEAQWPVQEAVIGTLGNQTVLTDEVLSRLVALLDTEDQLLRTSIIKSIGSNTRLPEHIARKITLLQNDDKLQGQGATALTPGNQTVLTDEALCRILRLLDDDEESVQNAAVSGSRARGSRSDTVLSAHKESDHPRRPERSTKGKEARLKQNQSSQREGGSKAPSQAPDQLAEAALAMIAKGYSSSEEPLLRDALEAIGQTGLPQNTAAGIAQCLESQNFRVRISACEALVAQPELSAATLSPHLKSFYKELLSLSWGRDVCWVSSPSECYLRVDGRSIPLLDWTPRSTARIRSIAAEIGVPQPIRDDAAELDESQPSCDVALEPRVPSPDRRNVIASHWTNLVSRIASKPHNGLRGQQNR